MPHVQVVVDEQASVPPSLNTALARLNASVSFQPASLAEYDAPADAYVFVSRPRRDPRLAQSLRKVVARACGAVVIGGRRGERIGDAPIDYTHARSDTDLARRISEIIALRPTLRRINSARSADDQIQARYQRMAARNRKLARELSAATLPKYGPLRFEAVSRSVDDVSGDSFDIRRIDRRRICVTLTDAEGHGLPAAILNMRIEQALRRAGAADPADALATLNADLLREGREESSFATLVHATIDLQTLDVRLARGGAPYPIYRGPRGTLRLVRPNGPLVGVLPEARFDVATFRLPPGATLMLYSDGLEVVTAANAPDAVHAAVADLDEHVGGARPAGPAGWSATAAAPDQAITATPWYHEFARGGATPALRQAARRHDLLRRLGRPVDDLTMLAIRVAG